MVRPKLNEIEIVNRIKTLVGMDPDAHHLGIALCFSPPTYQPKLYQQNYLLANRDVKENAVRNLPTHVSRLIYKIGREFHIRERQARTYFSIYWNWLLDELDKPENEDLRRDVQRLWTTEYDDYLARKDGFIDDDYAARIDAELAAENHGDKGI